MRKAILAIAAAGSVFALTAAGATGLAITNSSAALKVANSGSGVQFTASACNDDYTVTWHTTNTAAIDTVTLTDTTATLIDDVPAACIGATFSVSLGAATFTGVISDSDLASTSNGGGPYNVPATADITPSVTITPAA